MAKFLVVYRGGKTPETPKAGERVMAAWNKWFEKLGAAVVDVGHPTGPGMTINGTGIKKGASAKVTGYSVVEANDLAAATKLVKGCPHLKAEGTLEVYETRAM